MPSVIGQPSGIRLAEDLPSSGGRRSERAVTGPGRPLGTGKSLQPKWAVRSPWWWKGRAAWRSGKPKDPNDPRSYGAAGSRTDRTESMDHRRPGQPRDPADGHAGTGEVLWKGGAGGRRRFSELVAPGPSDPRGSRPPERSDVVAIRGGGTGEPVARDRVRS